MAAAAVTTLNVEPGGSRIWVARLSSGWLSSFSSCWARRATAEKSWEASSLGSYVGSDDIARIRPVLGSIATPAAWTPWPRPCRPSNMASCASWSIVSWTLPPLGVELLSRSTRRVTNRTESSPDSTSFCDFSSPVWLK